MDFVINYVVIAVFALLYVGWKIVKKTTIVPLLEVDLLSGRREGLGEEGLGEGEGYDGGDADADADVDVGGEEKKRVAWYVKVKRSVFA